MPKQKTKAELEQDVRERDAAIEAMHRQLQQLQQQLASGVESSAMYRQALNDAESARKDAEMWRGLYEDLQTKQEENKSGMTPEQLHNLRFVYAQFPKPANKRGRKNKLTSQEMEEVKQLREQGISLRKIALQFDCSLATVQRTLGLI